MLEVGVAVDVINLRFVGGAGGVAAGTLEATRGSHGSTQVATFTSTSVQ